MALPLCSNIWHWVWWAHFFWQSTSALCTPGITCLGQEVTLTIGRITSIIASAGSWQVFGQVLKRVGELTATNPYVQKMGTEGKSLSSYSWFGCSVVLFLLAVSQIFDFSIRCWETAKLDLLSFFPYCIFSPWGFGEGWGEGNYHKTSLLLLLG